MLVNNVQSPAVITSNSIAYKLQLPEEIQIFPVFHVSQLKKLVGNHQATEKLSKGMEIEEEMVEPEAILQKRTKEIAGESIPQILIKWKGKTKEEATWMNTTDALNQFPDISLEDKAALEEVGNDSKSAVSLGPMQLKVYLKKKFRNKEGPRTDLGTGQLEFTEKK